MINLTNKNEIIDIRNCVYVCTNLCKHAGPPESWQKGVKCVKKNEEIGPWLEFTPHPVSHPVQNIPTSSRMHLQPFQSQVQPERQQC